MLVPLDKERGFDPHTTTCVRCHKDTGTILGVLITTEDKQGNKFYCIQGKAEKFNKAYNATFGYNLTGWKIVDDPETKIPTGLCKDCIEDLHTTLIEKTHFECAECNNHSVTPIIALDDHELIILAAFLEDTPGTSKFTFIFQSCNEHQ